jgi:hypothetical protein
MRPRPGFPYVERPRGQGLSFPLLTSSLTASGIGALTCRTIRSRPNGVSRAFLCNSSGPPGLLRLRQVQLLPARAGWTTYGKFTARPGSVELGAAVIGSAICLSRPEGLSQSVLARLLCRTFLTGLLISAETPHRQQCCAGGQVPYRARDTAKKLGVRQCCLSRPALSSSLLDFFLERRKDSLRVS